MPTDHDPAKAARNLRKHGIALSGCMEAFDGPMLTCDDQGEHHGEERFVSIGWTRNGIVVLVWIERDDRVRLISCREAGPHEREAYFRAFPQI